MTYFAARPSEGKENEDITNVLICCLYGSEDNTWPMLKPMHCLLLLPTCFKTCLYSERTAQRRERRHQLSFCLLKPRQEPCLLVRCIQVVQRRCFQQSACRFFRKLPGLKVYEQKFSSHFVIYLHNFC